jgi:hypothetical protein
VITRSVLSADRYSRVHTLCERQRSPLGCTGIPLGDRHKPPQERFPWMAGFSPQNIWKMRGFFLAWTAEVRNLSQLAREIDGEHLPRVAAEIPWGHGVDLQADANGSSRSTITPVTTSQTLPFLDGYRKTRNSCNGHESNPCLRRHPHFKEVVMTAFPGICPQPRVRGHSRRGLVAVLFLFASVAAASAPEGYIVPNFKDVDLTQIAEAVGTATGKNIVLDPRVHARVTMLSPTAISPAALYQAFLSILQAYGFTAVLSGNSVIVLPSGGQ